MKLQSHNPFVTFKTAKLYKFWTLNITLPQNCQSKICKIGLFNTISVFIFIQNLADVYTLKNYQRKKIKVTFKFSPSIWCHYGRFIIFLKRHVMKCGKKLPSWHAAGLGLMFRGPILQHNSVAAHIWHMIYAFWHLTYDILHLTTDIRHMTDDNWHMTTDRWQLTNDSWHLTADI